MGIKDELLDDCFRCEGDVPQEYVKVPKEESRIAGTGTAEIGTSFEEDLEKEFAELLED